MALAFAVPVSPLELPELVAGPCRSPSSAIEARIFSASVSVFSLSVVPPIVLTDRPLEVEFTCAASPRPDAMVLASTARFLSTHARLSISFETPGNAVNLDSISMVVRAFNGGWSSRLLVHPASWADATSISVASLALLGRPQPCACLPATLRVGYNRTPARAGAVLKAARTGDVLALQASLDAGESTEESDHVREEVPNEYVERIPSPMVLPVPLPCPGCNQNRCTAAFMAAYFGHLNALRVLLAAGADPAALNEARGRYRDGRKGGVCTRVAAAHCANLSGECITTECLVVTSSSTTRALPARRPLPGTLPGPPGM